MIRILKAFATAFCGLVTAVATAYVTMAVSRVFDVDFASFSIWFVIPVGAVSVGFLAVSGYYLASLWLHRRPTRMLLVEMLIAAGLAQFLIYYLGYRTQPVGDGHFAYQVVPFSDYLAVMLTKMHLKVNHATFDVGEVGGFGYLLAAIQFGGFLLGGLVLWCRLKARASCQGCSTYMRKLASRQKTFPSAAQSREYYDQLFRHPCNSAKFAALIRMPAATDKARKGAVKIVTGLYDCPKCSAQLVEEWVSMYSGERWSSVASMNRRVRIPSGIDLKATFAG